MARAFGGSVERAAQPEIGWMPLQTTGSAAARYWFGANGAPSGSGAAPGAGTNPRSENAGKESRFHTLYQWHRDSFVTLPPGAELIASSPACAHQAFALGPHLGMQFHIEITAEKIGDGLQVQTGGGGIEPGRMRQHHRMGFGMGQIETAAQSMANLVMQRHADRPQHRAAQP